MDTKLKKVMFLLCSGALLFSAAGCVGNADPVPSISAQPTQSPSVSSSPPSAAPTVKPTPTPIPGSSKGPAQNWPVPKMPAAAKEKSEAGIIAFTEHWFDVLEYMYITNDTKPLKAITEPICNECAVNVIDPADGLAHNKAWSSGGNLDIEVTLSTLTDQDSGVASFRLDREDLLVYDKNGDYYGKLPGTTKPDTGALVLEFSKGWKVTDLQWLDTK